MRRFVLCCCCLISISAPLAADDSPAPKTSYIYFSKGALPEGTARMSAEERTPKPTPITQADSRSRPGTATHRVSFETAEELGYEFPEPLPTGSSRYAPTFGSPSVSRLSGTRYGYTYGGRRYSAHCLTAPGYGSACCEPDLSYLDTGYRIECRNPGLLACLFGCHEPRCRVVKVKPSRCHSRHCATRVTGVPLPSFLLADIERYELPSTGTLGTAALPGGQSLDEDATSAPSEGAAYGPSLPLAPTRPEVTSPAPAPLPPSPTPLTDDDPRVPELSPPGD